VLNKFRQLASRLFPLKETEVKEAYDIWSQSYDSQPDNLMLALDETVFNELIDKVSFQNKVIADVGCGTGRHWTKMYAKQPLRLIGYDVSPGMLKGLKEKFPKAETHQLLSNQLEGLENESCDVIVSTLAAAHIQDIGDAFTEWNWVLKPAGHIIITDYHPNALAKGGNRTFTHNGKLIAVKNYVHPLEKIWGVANNLHYKVDRFIEKQIDESVKHYYAKQNAIKVYEKFKGTSIIYGAHLIKENAAK
jgi:ubiquinone/menaquinone biosynthesis C-methylase UbiE